MLSIVMKACCILGEPSKRANESCLQVKDSKTVGNSVVLSLQTCEMLTAADVLKASFFVVWYMLRRRVATSKVAKLQPALID